MTAHRAHPIIQKDGVLLSPLTSYKTGLVISFSHTTNIYIMRGLALDVIGASA